MCRGCWKPKRPEVTFSSEPEPESDEKASEKFGKKGSKFKHFDCISSESDEENNSSELNSHLSLAKWPPPPPPPRSAAARVHRAMPPRGDARRGGAVVRRRG
jgi:hypothetical protein